MGHVATKVVAGRSSLNDCYRPMDFCPGAIASSAGDAGV